MRSSALALLAAAGLTAAFGGAAGVRARRRRARRWRTWTGARRRAARRGALAPAGRRSSESAAIWSARSADLERACALGLAPALAERERGAAARSRGAGSPTPSAICAGRGELAPGRRRGRRGARRDARRARPLARRRRRVCARDRAARRGAGPDLHLARVRALAAGGRATLREALRALDQALAKLGPLSGAGAGGRRARAARGPHRRRARAAGPSAAPVRRPESWLVQRAEILEHAGRSAAGARGVCGRARVDRGPAAGAACDTGGAHARRPRARGIGRLAGRARRRGRPMRRATRRARSSALRGWLALGASPAAAESVGQFLVSAGASWRYLDDGSNQGTAWRASGFDDAAWAQGPAQLGYGDGDEATVVGCGPSAPACTTGNFITTYFRKSFTVSDPASIPQLQLSLLRDDGAVVYLNGVEVARSNLPAGAIASPRWLRASVAGAAESTFFGFAISSPSLRGRAESARGRDPSGRRHQLRRQLRRLAPGDRRHAHRAGASALPPGRDADQRGAALADRHHEHHPRQVGARGGCPRRTWWTSPEPGPSTRFRSAGFRPRRRSSTRSAPPRRRSRAAMRTTPSGRRRRSAPAFRPGSG